MYKDILCNIFNLREAYQKAHRGKGNDKRVIEFDKDVNWNLRKLQEQLANKNWKTIFRYYRFKIYQPKERIVDALEFEGRIVQHVLCDNILKPYFDKRLVNSNCACRQDKGTLFALNMLKKQIQKITFQNEECWALKIDIKKYFPSINRDILKSILSSFPDKEIKELLYYIIDNSPDEQGLPIGNQTSQWFALLYLNEFDRIIKEQYQMKCHVRYMDDIIILSKDKKQLQELFKYLREYAERQLKLKFNGKSQIQPLCKSVDFLGWKFHVSPSKRLILTLANDKRRQRKIKIRTIKKQLEKGIIDLDNYNMRIQSMKVNLSFGNTYKFQQINKIY